MSRLRAKISLSLDGFSAGPEQSVAEPLGRGGEALHAWAFELDSFRRVLGLAGGVHNPSSAVVERSWHNVGATVMGRNMFGGHPGPWAAQRPWPGWWGDDPPFHHPVFVLTHHPRPPLVCAGGTTFTFVTDGPHSALAQARSAAGGRDVSLAGGAATIQQFLAADLVDELQLNLVPILLGAGTRLLEGLGTDLHGLALERVTPAPGVVHLEFARPAR
jgi:dihydrofolate reductase